MPYLLLPGTNDNDCDDSEDALLANLMESDPATVEEYAESSEAASNTLTATNLRTIRSSNHTKMSRAPSYRRIARVEI